MKKIICTLALGFLVLSCSKDEDSATVVATWDRNQYGTIASDGTVSNLTDYIHSCPSEKDNFSFTTNGVFEDEELYDNSVDAAKSQLTGCSSYKDNGTYALNGSTLTLTYTNEGAYDVVYEVVSLTETELKLKKPTSIKSRFDANYYTFTRR